MSQSSTPTMMRVMTIVINDIFISFFSMRRLTLEHVDDQGTSLLDCAASEVWTQRPLMLPAPEIRVAGDISGCRSRLTFCFKIRLRVFACAAAVAAGLQARGRNQICFAIWWIDRQVRFITNMRAVII